MTPRFLAAVCEVSREMAETKKTLVTRQEAIEELSTFGITGPQVYLVDIIPLLEMMWVDGKVQESEVGIFNEYLHERVRQINERAGCVVIDFNGAQAFAYRFIEEKPNPEFLRRVRSLVGPVALNSSDESYVDSVAKLLIETCIDIGAISVRRYPYGPHERFDEDKKACLFDIVKTLVEYRRPGERNK